MSQHPARQVNVSRKGVLCAPDYSKFFETLYIKANSQDAICSNN